MKPLHHLSPVFEGLKSLFLTPVHKGKFHLKCLVSFLQLHLFASVISHTATHTHGCYLHCLFLPCFQMYFLFTCFECVALLMTEWFITLVLADGITKGISLPCSSLSIFVSPLSFSPLPSKLTVLVILTDAKRGSLITKEQHLFKYQDLCDWNEKA